MRGVGSGTAYSALFCDSLPSERGAIKQQNMTWECRYQMSYCVVNAILNATKKKKEMVSIVRYSSLTGHI